MTAALEILYEANKQGVWLWIQDGELRFKSPKSVDVSGVMSKLKANKSEIIAILKNNGVSSDKVVQPLIYKIHNSESVLSFAQERLWFVERYEDGSNAYHVPSVYELDSKTDVEGVKYALTQIVSRHEVLRSTIEQDQEGNAFQLVHDRTLPIEEIHLKDSEEYNFFIKNDIDRPFDLSKEYPIRIKLYIIQSDKITSKKSTNKILLLINKHHIACDGWSIDIFQKELSAYYSAYVRKDVDFSLPELVIQYKDYAFWQRNYLKDSFLDDQLNYWKQRLSGYQTLMLPTDYARASEKNYEGVSQLFSVSKDISQKLRQIAKDLNVTVNSVMLSTINILLSKYTGQDDVVIGSPIANRHHGQTEGLIGFFINTLANRTLLNGSQNFESLVLQVHKEQVDAQLHQDVPFEMIINELKVERDASRHPVFQVMFGVQSFGRQLEDKGDSWLKHYDIGTAYEVAKFDLTIYIDDANDELEGVIVYASNLFKRSTIEGLITNYVHLLDQLGKFPLKQYSQISLLNTEERNKIVHDWNATEQEYPLDKTLAQLFYEQVKKTPDNVATVFGREKLTYKELNEKSNQLARHLRNEQFRLTGTEMVPSTFVALCLNRGLEMIVGILAVLKAGGAYVALDPNFPQERISFIIGETGASLILTQRDLDKVNLSGLPLERIVYSDLSEELYKKEYDVNLPCISKADDLAYVIFTSGTTGKPKGVLIEQKAIVCKIHGQIQSHAIDASFKVGCKIPYIFDPSLREMFVTLLSGAQLVIISDELNKNTDALVEYCIDHEVNLLTFVPSHLNVFLASLKRYGSHGKLAQNLKMIYSCGERLSLGLANELKEFLPGVVVKNQYGPSEVSQVSFEFDLDFYDTRSGKIPLGKPVKNTKSYVLDANQNVVPVGVIGELYLSGPGMAREYLNRVDLTNERFVANPFVTREIENGYSRMYRTGDLVKWLPDGNLEYLSRNDDQVKIRGYRIELAEIEKTILQIKEIRQCCVVLKIGKGETSDNKYLVAYYLTDDSTGRISPAFIQNKLAASIPEYMVPDVMIAVESFPLTSNGKLNKNALPDPVFTLPENEYVAPTTKMEEDLCAIWKDILNSNRIGTSDDFFRIGGNSIKAIQLSHKASKVLGFEMKVADVFKYRTIVQLISNCLGKPQLNISKTEASSSVLSFAQERLWFIEKYEDGTNAYHIPLVYELNDSANIEGLKYALRQIVLRHEILRSTIDQDVHGQGIQKVHVESLPIKDVHLSDKEDYDSLINAEINRPFHLSKEYPIRANFYFIKSTDENIQSKTLLLINIHHIASDAWSYFVFQKELFSYYEAYCNNNVEFKLPLLEIQYKDYAAWEKSYLTEDKLKIQLDYWKGKLTGFQTLEFPTDHPRLGKIDFRGSKQDFVISIETSQKLKTLANRHGLTLNSVMMTSIAVLLSKYTGQDDIVIGGTNANRYHRQTEELIGFFVNTQANRILLKKDQSFEELIKQVHEDQVQAQLHHNLPFEKLVDELGVKRDPSRHPIFQVSFGVQNFDDQDSAINQGQNYLKPYELETAYDVERFDLSIRINDRQGELGGTISYVASLFNDETISRFIDHYKNLLDQLVQFPDRPYHSHNILTPKEFKQIVYDWNSREKNYSQDKTISQLFEQHVKHTPDKVALVCDGQELTYKELNEKSNQLARHIKIQYERKAGIPLVSGTLVALCMERSLEMVVGIVAVLKAGGAYVPMDPTYPQDRIDYMLGDIATFLILVKNQAAVIHVKLPEDKIVSVDLHEEFYKTGDASDLTLNNGLKDLAYVIYTSGSTGRPKGVMIEHASVINYVYNASEIILDDIENVDFSTNIAFDLTVTTTICALLTGKKVCIYTGELKNIDQYANHLIANEVDFIKTTPALLTNLSVDYLANYKIKQAFVGGEKLEESQLNHITTFVGNLIDEYGPTEATVGTTYINKSLVNNKGIGKPYFNYKTYILDSNNSPVPIGVVGELFIGGAGLSRGYLNREDLTAERFILNPFDIESDKEKGYSKIYRTGDLVRWMPGGNLEFIGRNDEQIKIRGYRVELGEIEHALTQIEGIKQVCVLVKEKETELGKDKYIAAYYISDQKMSTLDHTSISEQLSCVLPDYMVPTAFKEIQSFPLTANGKLDKTALSDLDIDVSAAEYVAPTTEAEVAIADIWKEMLKLEKVGITDDFFQIGGNSILAIHVSHRISKLLDFDIKTADMFRFKTIEQLLTAKQTNQKLKLVKPYGNKYNRNLSDIIFVHPGTAGSEVYQYVSELLAEKFNCIGIDNYNLHSEKKIGSLNELANLYLSTFEKVYAFSESVNLFGWSLGGRIALEMAAILESKGYKNINVVLLDTRIPDEISRGIFKQLDIEWFVNDFRKHLLEAEYMPEYVEKVISSLDSEFELSYSYEGTRLEYSHVVLFKAIQDDEVLRNEVFNALHNHFLDLESNNVNLMTTNLEVINLECYHSNILETKVVDIVNYLLSEVLIEERQSS